MEEMSQRKAFAPCASGINLTHGQKQDNIGKSKTSDMLLPQHITYINSLITCCKKPRN
jgi:hypothetical protein